MAETAVKAMEDDNFLKIVTFLLRIVSFVIFLFISMDLFAIIVW